VAEIHMGLWRNHTGGDDQDCYHVGITQDYALILLSYFKTMLLFVT
jgi:hypothetical protein